MSGDRPKGWRLLVRALQTRKSSSMLAFGFASGLPYALLIGTLNAWLGEAKINLATIGVLSWIGLSYSFKFLWSPIVDRWQLPLIERLGRRKSWIIFCQFVMLLAFAGLATTDPAASIGVFAIFAVVAAIASATQDVAIDAWRIDVADEETKVELLSAIYQFGYRIASIVGGAFALFLAARMSWTLVYLLMAALIGLMAVVALFAPDTERPPKGALHESLTQPGEIDFRTRAIALAIVGISWFWAIAEIAVFMTSMLAPLSPGETRPSASDFLAHTGPWIVAATVLVPLIVSA
ncbi:MAG: MFS transporter, partial [Sphingomonadales bacterium]